MTGLKITLNLVQVEVFSFFDWLAIITLNLKQVELYRVSLTGLKITLNLEQVEVLCFLDWFKDYLKPRAGCGLGFLD